MPGPWALDRVGRTLWQWVTVVAKCHEGAALGQQEIPLGSVGFELTIAFELPIQSAAIEAQHLGGQGLVPVDRAEHAEDIAAFDLLIERSSEGFSVAMTKVLLRCSRDLIGNITSNASPSRPRGTCSLSPAKRAEKLLAYGLAGNVRELQNSSSAPSALTKFEQIIGSTICRRRSASTATTPSVIATENPSELLSMEEVERRYILRVLRTVNGNKTLAAQVLGFDRRTLYRKLERYGEARTQRSQAGSSC